MAKKENIFKQKHQKSIPEYIGSIKKTPKGATKNREGQQKTTSPQPKPIQSTKSIIERGLETINNLDHTQILQRKENLSP